MADVPKVSVVVGAYNARRYIAEMIESVLAQTFGDFEFIIVDDGSTDGTLPILRRYEARDSRVRILANPHGGIVDAANAGLAAARAELIARADADDINLPDRFAKQVQYLADHPDVVAVGARMEMIDPFSSPLGVTGHSLDHATIEKELLEGNGWAMPQPVAMMRKSAAMQAGAYQKSSEWVEDLDLFLRMAQVGRLANLPDVLLKYRLHLRSTNFTRHELQARLTRDVLVEAHRRRGLTMPERWKPPLVEKLPPDEQCRQWAWKALRSKNVPAARKNALAAVKKSPLAMSSWNVLYCALRGH